MLLDTLDKYTFVATKHLFLVDFVAMQTIWPCNQHTTSGDNSNYCNFHAHFRLSIHRCNFFVVLYLVELACMQNTNPWPSGKNTKFSKKKWYGIYLEWKTKNERDHRRTSSVWYFGLRDICCLNTSMNRSITVLLNETPSKIVIGRSIRSCSVLKSKALMRIVNSDTPARVGFTRIFTNWIASVDISLKSCESLYKKWIKIFVIEMNE